MRSHLLTPFLVLALFGLSSCRWKPDVTAVPITAPWAAMGLPVHENAVVWGSTPVQFKAVHKDGRPLVSSAYLLALTKAGWMETSRRKGDQDYYDFAKGDEKLQMEIYDFHKTGVILEKK